LAGEICPSKWATPVRSGKSSSLNGAGAHLTRLCQNPETVLKDFQLCLTMLDETGLLKLVQYTKKKPQTIEPGV